MPTIIIKNGAHANTGFPLGHSATSIGRDVGRTIQLRDPDASRKHALICPTPDGSSFRLLDQNSRNGTYLNKVRVVPNQYHVLRSGDLIRIGSTELQFWDSDTMELPDGRLVFKRPSAGRKETVT